MLKSDKTRRRFRRHAVGVVAGVLAMSAAATAHAASSAGCTYVNAGNLDGNHAGNTATTSKAFFAGEVLNVSLVLTGNAHFEVTPTVVVNSNGSGTYTFASDGSYSLKYDGTFATNAVFTVTCTPYTPAASSSNTVGEDAAESKHHIAPAVMTSSAATISNLIGTNVKGSFNRIGGATSGGVFRAADFTDSTNGGVEVADASPTIPNVGAQNARPGEGRLGGFGEAAYSSLHNSENGGRYHGSIKNLVFGIDYKVKPELLAGIAAGYEWADFTTTYNSGWLEGKGLTLAPYFGYALGDTIVDLTLGHSWLRYSNYQGSGTASSGAYDASRDFINVNATRTTTWNSMRLSPTAGVLLVREVSEGYEDSTGAAQQSTSAKLGRMSLGGEIGRAWDLSQTGTGGCTCVVEPYATASARYDFIHNAPATLTTGKLAAVDEWTGKAGGGIKLTIASHLTFTVEGTYDSIAAQHMTAWTARTRLDFSLEF